VGPYDECKHRERNEAVLFSGLESPWHLLIVLVIAVLVLGPKKLPEVGRSLGSGIRQFKSSIEGNDHPEAPEPTAEKSPESQTPG
jgi:sec-independent protein translocase protein TatA